MSELQNINVPLIVIILQILVCLGFIFLIGYAKKKASNYADKKDLKELTAIVEREKSKYATDLSIIKSQLDLVVGNKKSYREKEVEAIYEFYSVCNWLVYDFLNLDFTWFNSKHYELIQMKSSEFFDNIKKLTVSKGKFDLFVADIDLRNAAHNLHLACINYSGKIQLFITRLKFSLEKQIDQREKFSKYFESKQRDAVQENKLINEDKLLRDEISAYTEEYKELRKEEHDMILIKSISQFESAARVYLSKI
jgi:hypothetical protein